MSPWAAQRLATKSLNFQQLFRPTRSYEHKELRRREEKPTHSLRDLRTEERWARTRSLHLGAEGLEVGGQLVGWGTRKV